MLEQNSTMMGIFSSDMKSSRRKARSIALQILYEIDCAKHNKEDVINRYKNNDGLDDDTMDFIRSMVNGVLENQPVIDGYIKRFAPAWPLEQISIVDRNILRLAIFEILLDNKTPVKVAIDEAVELAKKFGSANSFKFVNGVLGSISSITENK